MWQSECNNNISYSRYQRGSRSITDNLQLSKEAVAQKSQASSLGGVNMEVDEEEYDIPDEIESVIGRFHYNTFISMVGIFTKHICFT